MLALRTFTVSDLAEFSGVNPHTVRTILNREQQFVEKLDPEQSDEKEPGRPGGRYARYVVYPEQRKRLRQMIEELRMQLPPSPESTAPDVAGPEGVPVTDEKRVEEDVPPDLLLAEDALVRLFPESINPEDKRHLISLANYHTDTARIRIESRFGDTYSVDENPKGLELKARLRGVEALRRFSEAELLALSGAENRETDAVKLREELAHVTEELIELGQQQLAMGIAHRALKSEIFDRAAAAAAGSVQPQMLVRAEPEVTESAETAELHPIILRVETVSSISDLRERRRECLVAARVSRAHFTPNDSLIGRIVQQIVDGTQFRLNKYEVATLAAEPEFYFGKTFKPGRKGLFLDSLRYIQTVLDFKQNGAPVGSIAKNVLERV
jgi:hypothetical protein